MGLELPAEFHGRLTLEVALPVYVSLVRYHRVIATQHVEAGATEVVFEVDSRSPLLAATSVRIRLVDGITRDPLAGIPVQWTHTGVQMGQTDAEGVWSVAKCQPGRHELNVEAKGYESLQRFLVEPGINDFGDIALEKAQWASGMVVDESGAGIPVKLRFLKIDPSTGEPLPELVRRGFGTKEDGSFRIHGLSRARYRLTLNDPEPWGACALEFDTRAGPVEGLRLQLARGVPLILNASTAETQGISFRILDASGTTVLTRRRISQEPQKVLLAPGSYELELRSQDRPPERKSFEIESEPVVLSIP